MGTTAAVRELVRVLTEASGPPIFSGKLKNDFGQSVAVNHAACVGRALNDEFTRAPDTGGDVVLAVPMEKNQRITVSPDLIAQRDPVYRQLYQDSGPSF